MEARADQPMRGDRVTVVEGIGYAGTAIALVGTGAVVGQVTDGSRVVTAIVSAVVAVVLFGVGWLAGGAEHDRLQRFRSVLWFLAILSLQSFFATLIEPDDRGGFFLALLLTALPAFALWLVLARTLQQLAFVGSAFSAAIVLTVPDPMFGFLAPDLRTTALVTILLGAGWFVLGWLQLVRPPRTAMVLGSITLLVGTLMLTTESEEFAFVLMAIVGGTLLALGNVRGDRAVGGVGIFGLLLGTALLFQTFASGTAESVLSLVIGVALLVVAIVLARSWGHVPTQLPPIGGTAGGGVALGGSSSEPSAGAPSEGTTPPPGPPPPADDGPAKDGPERPPRDDGGFSS